MAIMRDEDIKKWAISVLKERDRKAQREIDKIMEEKSIEETDRLELELMGIKS